MLNAWKRAWLYLHTVRYLKPQQIFYRIWFRLTKPTIDESHASAVRNKSGTFHSPARRSTSLLNAYTFYFLNQSGSLSTLGWVDTSEIASRSKLWRYNQHYFDDLNAMNAPERSEWHFSLLEHWVSENEPGFGIGWDPYPTSLRIVNWVKWSYAGNELPATCVQSLAVQVRFLMKRIELHILGNHLFANAKALIFAGLFFSGKEADQWLQRGLKIVSDELLEQVLADGGNFERSPMYHAIFLEDLLDLINLAQAFPDVTSEVNVIHWREVAQSMLNWLNGMLHPDGEISFFNDAAIGIAPSPVELNTYAARLGVSADIIPARTTHFTDCGYIRLSSAKAVALLDVAKVGPDYLPGHAHADTLSFELSLFCQRVFVNGGTSQYGTDAVRKIERGTSAHNTVVINNENSSEVWGGFRVARRAYPRDLVINETPKLVSVTCSHDGYCRLSGRPTHRRRWDFSESSLTISDQITGDFDSAVAYFHVHPDVGMSANSDSSWQLKLPKGQKITVTVEMGDSHLSPCFYAPEFGRRLKTQCLEVPLGQEGARVTINWSSND